MCAPFFHQRLWSWLRSWLRNWLLSSSRWRPGSISIALTTSRTGQVAANLAIAIACVVLPTFVKAVATSAHLLNWPVTPRAFAPTWAHASPSRRRQTWSAKWHLALHLEPVLHQHNM